MIVVSRAHTVMVLAATVTVAARVVIRSGQALRDIGRQVARIPREHEELIRVRDTGRMIGIGYRPDKIVIVRNEQRVLFHAADHDIGTEREAFELRESAV